MPPKADNEHNTSSPPIADEKTARLIEDATRELQGDNNALKARLKKIETEANKPLDTDAIAKTLCRALKIDQLTPKHWQLLAQMLGRGISVGNKTYAPASAAEIKENEENLRLASAVTEAMQALSGAPPPALLLAACYPVQRALIR